MYVRMYVNKKVNCMNKNSAHTS